MSAHLIALGRAYVRLIESASHIAARTELDEERIELGIMIGRYRAALRELLAKVSPEIGARIMVVSEKVTGAVNETGLN